MRTVGSSHEHEFLVKLCYIPSTTLLEHQLNVQIILQTINNPLKVREPTSMLVAFEDSFSIETNSHNVSAHQTKTISPIWTKFDMNLLIDPITRHVKHCFVLLTFDPSRSMLTCYCLHHQNFNNLFIE